MRERDAPLIVAREREGRARQELVPDQNMYQMCGGPALYKGMSHAYAAQAMVNFAYPAVDYAFPVSIFTLKYK